MVKGLHAAGLGAVFGLISAASALADVSVLVPVGLNHDVLATSAAADVVSFDGTNLGGVGLSGLQVASLEVEDGTTDLGGTGSLFGRKAAPLADQGRTRDQAAPQISSAMLADMDRAAGSAQWRCLTEAIYFEARGEPIAGQVAVAEVVLNRVDSPRHPETICKVVNQGTGEIHACQFSYTCDGVAETIVNRSAWQTAGKIARLLMDGAPRRLTGDATHYHADYVDPSWSKVYPRTAEVGTHIFYKQIPGS